MNIEMNMSVAERRNFIANLELADVTDDMLQARVRRSVQGHASPVIPDAPVGAVAGSAIVGFTEGVSQQNREDILDALMYAQLAADKAFAGEKGSAKWYSMFNDVLQSMGMVSWGWMHSHYQSRDRTFTMDHAALEVLESAIKAAALSVSGALLLQLAQDTLAALKAKQEPLRLFERQARTHNGASFAVGSCTQGPTGEASVVMGAVSFDTASSVTNVLFWDWHSTDVKVYRGEQKLVLNSRAYGDVRDTVRDRLSANARRAILEFDI